MKKNFISLYCLLVYSYGFSQGNANVYLELINKANSLYEARDYKNAAFTFSSAFRIAVTPPTINDRWTAAGSWSLSNNNDSAFSQLSFIANSNNLTYSKAINILRDEDFTDL